MGGIGPISNQILPHFGSKEEEFLTESQSEVSLESSNAGVTYRQPNFIFYCLYQVIDLWLQPDQDGIILDQQVFDDYMTALDPEIKFLFKSEEGVNSDNSASTKLRERY